jgi:DNA replication initiation complex subunit (GINS family)|tara:strand:- start:350 stop:652 length:303 start_codon:yes stop_codon:yes gene_type:complete
MPGFFDALKNFKGKERAKPMVEIQGTRMEVTLDMFKKVERHGAENFELKNGKVVLKATFLVNKTYETLVKTEKGYVFFDRDPYWPKEFTDGGHTWQIESE